MPYMVIFQSPDGNPGYNQFDHLEGAVEFVEEMRNSAGVENARMFELEEITFEFKPIYKVQMAALEAGPSAAEPVVDVAPPVVEPEPAYEEPAFAEPPAPLAEEPVAVPEPADEEAAFATPPPPAEPVIDLPSDLPPPPAEPYEAYPPPPAAPVADGGPSFAPPPPMPPNEVQAPGPVADEPAQPPRRGLFGR